MIAESWEYHGIPVQCPSEYGSSRSSMSVGNDHAKTIGSDADKYGVHVSSAEPKLCRSESSNWEELQTDPPDLYASPWSPDRTPLNSSRVYSETSADTQGREIPCSKLARASEGISYDTSPVRNPTDRANQGTFDGRCSKLKHEYKFPQWGLPSKIRRKFSVPNKDSTDDAVAISKSPDHSNADEGPRSNTSSRNTAPRVCFDCSTTKTPLWRSGPQGPKSLCNACGIRYRKKRRALTASGNSEAAISIPPKKRNKSHLISSEKKVKKYIASDRVELMALCQRHGLPGFLQKTNSKISILQKHSAMRGRFAEEEEEAAVLLMALSYGLVHA